MPFQQHFAPTGSVSYYFSLSDLASAGKPGEYLSRSRTSGLLSTRLSRTLRFFLGGLEILETYSITSAQTCSDLHPLSCLDTTNSVYDTLSEQISDPDIVPTDGETAPPGWCCRCGTKLVKQPAPQNPKCPACKHTKCGSCAKPM